MERGETQPSDLMKN